MANKPDGAPEVATDATPDLAQLEQEVAALQQEELQLQGAPPRYAAADLINSQRFASYPKAVLRGILTQPDYTMADAQATLDAYLGKGGSN